jgi:hypothetical protein
LNAHLDWVEKAALENLRGHLQSADVLAKEAAATLTILLAGLSGAFTFAVGTQSFRVGAIILTVYLFVLCFVLVIRCMMIGRLPAITNEPRNLNQDGYELEALRRTELDNIQGRIDQTARRNAVTARWLNYVRLGAILSPAIFIVATFLAAPAHRAVQAAAGG